MMRETLNFITLHPFLRIVLVEYAARLLTETNDAGSSPHVA